MTEQPTIIRIKKRVHCPSCHAIISVPYATDGTWIIQDGKPLRLQEGDLTDGQEIAIKELIRKTIQQMDAEGFWNHSHEDEGEEVEAKP